MLLRPAALKMSEPMLLRIRLLPMIATSLHRSCACICLGKKQINFSAVFAGQAVGLKEAHNDVWRVSFMEYDLGYFDL